MPKFYKPGKQEARREKATYGASISFERKEVRQADYEALSRHDEMFWVAHKKAIDIGFSITQVQTGNIKEAYTCKVYSQWADMKDAGYSMSVTHCSNPFEALMCCLAILQACKFRLDTIPESDVEF
ncbi:MAG: hypothetical protein ACRC78_18625 [Planktothrix sp.]